MEIGIEIINLKISARIDLTQNERFLLKGRQVKEIDYACWEHYHYIMVSRNAKNL